MLTICMTPKIRESPLASMKRTAAKENPLRVWTTKNSMDSTLYSRGFSLWPQKQLETGCTYVQRVSNCL